jgi:hypothetical protein
VIELNPDTPWMKPVDDYRSTCDWFFLPTNHSAQ